MPFLNHIFNKHRPIAVSILSVLLFVSLIKVFASGPFSPGTQLDPDCLPGQSGCLVSVSTPNFSQVLTAGNTTGANDITITGGANRFWQQSTGGNVLQLNFLQSYLQLLGYDGVNGSHINIGGGAVTVSSRSGIQYESDYSANFSTRSLVDKEYVDARFGAVKLLGSMAGADMNSTADQQITLSGGSRFVVTDVLITNASTDLSANTNDLEIWTGTLRSGDQIARCNVQRLLTPSQFANFSEGSMGMVSEFTTGGPLYLSLGTAHGSAATADVYVYGYVLN